MSQEQQKSTLFLEESIYESDNSNPSSTTNIKPRQSIDNTMIDAEELQPDEESSNEEVRKGRGPNREYEQLEIFEQIKKAQEHIAINFN